MQLALKSLQVLTLAAVLWDAAGAAQYVSLVRQGAQATASPALTEYRRTHLRVSLQELTPHGDPIDTANHDGGISPSGVIVGAINNRPIEWIHGVRTDLPLPSGMILATPKAINRTGEIAGYCSSIGPQVHAVVWDGGQPRLLPSPTAFPNAEALAINDQGETAGRIFGASSPKMSYWAIPAHACIWTPSGRLRDLGVPPGYLQSRAYGINDSGVVVGWVLTGTNHTHAALWDANGRFTDLGVLPGGGASGAIGINNAGWIAGTGDGPDGGLHILCWHDGRVHDLGRPLHGGWCEAEGINSRGQILIDGVYDPKVMNGRTFVALWDAAHGMRILALPPEADFATQKTAALGDSGQVLDAGIAASGNEGFDHRYVLLTPLEP